MVIKPQTPNSSFLSIEKDMGLIVDKMLRNERLKRLLYYTTKDALDRPNIGEEASVELFGKNIKIVPKLYVDDKVYNYIFIMFDDFTPSGNPEFRDNFISFTILCHYDQWPLKDFSLRPYKIAAEIDSMFNNQKLTGIGTLEFAGASMANHNDEFAGIVLLYRATHGGEDKKKMPNPNDEERFLKDWEDYTKNE